MPRGKKELAEQITPELREVVVEEGSGKTVAEAVKKIGVTEQTYSPWKKKFGGLRIDQAKRLRGELLSCCSETSCWSGNRSTRCSRPRCSSSIGGSTPTLPGRTVP